MKIVHISHLYHPSSGGVQFFFKNISERLVKDYGDDVTVVTTNSYYGPERKIFKKIEPAEEVINGVKVIRFPYTRWHIKPYAFIYKVLAKLSIKKPEAMVIKSYGPYSAEMKKYLMQVQADAFCASSSNYYYMQLPLWKKCNFFYFGSIHWEHDESKTTLYPTQVASMNASTLCLANTAYEKTRMIKSGVKQEKIFVLGVGVDMEPFINVDAEDVAAFRKEIAVPADALLIGYAGRIERTKNVLLLIKAFEKISHQFPEIYLLIAGSASHYVAELQSYCNNLPAEIAARIKWQVNFPIEKKPRVFNSIDILVLPSHNESFGIVFLEAWSCKKPVIGASIGAVRDVISDGVDGLLMQMDNESSLAEKLTELIKSETLRKTMGENGFSKVKENYTWDIITTRLRQCYIDASLSKN
ncbi:MAG: glycosyltransferase family 4 protein [Segetibacter sp.]|nr:glycosyltransferase family 4 protein [Segetibacter sp.]